MKLPIQSQPVLRNISTARISYGSSMVHPQGCVPLWERNALCPRGGRTIESQIERLSCRLGNSIFCTSNPAACCL